MKIYPFIGILEKPNVLQDLEKYNILPLYKKNKNLLLAGFSGKLDFKRRMPKSGKIYSFRITQKYRAYGKIIDGNLIVYHIDKHQ